VVTEETEMGDETAYRDLDELVRRAKEAFDRLTPEEQAAHRDAQRRSWVYGNVALSNPEVTREMVDRVIDEMEGK
jgi:hypothetical protein